MQATSPRSVGINALFLEPRMGGLETYVRELVPELVRLAPDVRFSVYCSRGARAYLREQGWGEGIELITPPLIGRRGFKAAGELTLLGLLAGARVDLLHSVAMTAPLATRAVNVVTLADVTWLLAPDPGEAWTMRLWRAIVPPVARRADRLIVPSAAAAAQVSEQLRVPRGRIEVIALGQGTIEAAGPTPEQELRDRFALGGKRVILTVSAKRVHKNLERLVRAMPGVLARCPDAALVLPGNPTAHERDLRALAGALGVAASVAFPPYVSAADLEGLYALAECFVFPSLNEGFGLPILEAMRRGVPVACSRASALPEVAGEAALYFDADSAADIARALKELLADRELARRLVALGRARAAEFSWSASAERTLACYERACREHG